MAAWISRAKAASARYPGRARGRDLGARRAADHEHGLAGAVEDRQGEGREASTNSPRLST